MSTLSHSPSAPFNLSGTQRNSMFSQSVNHFRQPSRQTSLSQSSSNLQSRSPPPEYHYPCTADDYDVLSEIGVGAFATVYRAVVKATGEEVAVKVMDLDQFNTNWDEIRNEISIMCQLHHPNVVKIKTSFVDGQDLWIVMELLDAGSCAQLIKQFAPTGFKDEGLIATILKESLQGLVYFHKDGHIHRDLKAGNILIRRNGDVLLADFGVAGTLMENGDRKKNRQTFTGTPCWMAPEVMEHTHGYDAKADIWSFGITALELAYGRAPYAKFQPMKVMLKTLQEDPPTAEIYHDNSYVFSKSFHEMVSKCLRKDPKKRISAAKLMEHKFFKSAKDNKYIVEKLVKQVPWKDLARMPHQHICKEKTLVDQAKIEKSKPVSVGSWSFDSDSFEEFKRKALEESEKSRKEASDRQREIEVEASYHQGEDAAEACIAQRNMQQNELYTELPIPSSMHIHSSPSPPHAYTPQRQGRFMVSDEDDEQGPVEDIPPEPSNLDQVGGQFGRFSIQDED
jgi:serine/threonine-protein kinase OSR1/STK39